MPDLSADRPLPLPDDVRSAVATALEAANAATWEAGRAIPDWNALASAALVALAARSLLLPPSAEHREELRTRWQVQYLDKAFAERHAYFFDDRAEADECLATVRASPRYSEIKLLTKVSTPWVEVDGSQPGE